MKFLLSFFLLGITFCYGQHQRVEFPDSGATFRYLLVTNWVGHFTGIQTNFHHNKDTLIFDHKQNRWVKTMVFYGDGADSIFRMYMAKDTHLIWWNGFPENRGIISLPWPDFTKKVGEKHNDQLVTKVDSIESMGIVRKRMYLNYSREPAYIEGIGPVNDFQHQTFYNGLITRMELLCFYVKDSLTYVNPKYGNCDTIWDYNLSLGEKSRLSDPTVSSRESMLSVYLPFKEEAHEWRIQVFDAAGRRVFNQHLDQTSSQISLPVENGIYLYTLTKSERMVEQGKLLFSR